MSIDTPQAPTTPAVEAPTAVETKPAAIEKIRLPSGEYELEQLDRFVAKGKGADALVQKHQALEKEFAEFRDLPKKDLKSFLRSQDLGLSSTELEQLAVDIINERLTEESKDPVVREKEALQRERDELKREKEERLKAQKEAEETELRETFQKQLMSNLGEELGKSPTFSSLPRAEQAEYCSQVARVLHAALEAKKSMTISQAVEKVAKLQGSQVERYIKNLPAKDFVTRFPELTEGVRKELLSKVSGGAAPQAAPSNPGKAKDKPKETKRPSLSELIQYTATSGKLKF